MSSDTPSDPYDALCEQYRRASALADAGGVLHWDQQVTMPEGGTPARAKQLSAISSVRHDLLVEDRVQGWLDDLAAADLDGERAAVVREIGNDVEREANVPSALVADLSAAQTEAQQVWKRAKAADDWEAFVPTLDRVLELDTERAGYVDPETDPYRVFFEDGEPYLPLSTVEDIFDRLREELVPLVDDIRESDVELADPFEGTFDEDAQMALSEDVLDLLGYDRDRGRLDLSAHPFTVGSQYDCRITTRFREGDPLDALTATIHEFGHATYQLGLRTDEFGTPLGQARGGIHESQSRFWENHVGRTKAFWELFAPTMREHFPQLADVTADELYQAANRIYPENTIRVEADELTYHLHILLRAEIEQAVLAGEVALDEVPREWNRLMDDYLGVRPDADADGCLQDIHWTGGFASFQSYTVGSVLAAQLADAMEADLGDLDGLVREGEFEPMHEWMTEHVHRHGRRYRTQELIERATGEPLTADYFLAYAREKFGDLYDL